MRTSLQFASERLPDFGDPDVSYHKYSIGYSKNHTISKFDNSFEKYDATLSNFTHFFQRTTRPGLNINNSNLFVFFFHNFFTFDFSFKKNRPIDTIILRVQISKQNSKSTYNVMLPVG